MLCKLKINKKIKLIIGASMIGVMALLGLFSFGDVKYSSKEGLSYEEKKRDAKYFVDFLENTYPYFEEIKKESGQDVLGNKSKIINSISKTSSDEDFYYNISMLLRKFTYGTAEIPYSWDHFSNIFTYTDKELGIDYSSYREKAIKGKEKWESMQINYWQKTFTPGNANFICINGDYYVNTSQNPQVHIGDKLTKIDGIPVDDYVKKMPLDKYFKTYDYTYEKYISPYYLTYLKDKNSKKNITIINSLGEEKEVELLPHDESKPLLEDGYSKSRNTIYSQGEMEAAIKVRENKPFLNILENEKTVLLNFSAYKDVSTYYTESGKKENLFLNIDKSDALILDLRNGYDIGFLSDILGYISPRDLDYFDYRVFKKSKVIDEYIRSYKNNITPFITEVTSPIETLEKSYPLSEYYIFKEKGFEIKGKNKYKGKVYILFDGSFSNDYGLELIDAIIKNNLATVISTKKFNLKDFQYDSIISTVLPNSNLLIQVNSGKKVDENGVFVENKIITPQVILQKDANTIIDRLKRGGGEELSSLKEEMHNNKDEYYKEVLKLIN